jgi:outer membrane immunogenic protein
MRTMFIALAAVSTAALVLPATARAQTFTGPRVEASAGYDATHADDGIASTPNSLEGIRVGGAIGYDHAIGDVFTIGAEAGFGFNVTGDLRYAAGNTATRLTTGHDLDLSLRLGAKVTPTTLIYAKGGYANSQFKARTIVGGTTGTTVTEIEDDEDGWRIGAGVEQMITDRIYAKAEYRYTDYGNDVSRHQALVGLGYRF